MDFVNRSDLLNETLSVREIQKIVFKFGLEISLLDGLLLIESIKLVFN
jgi:hypothetical protein